MRKRKSNTQTTQTLGGQKLSWRKLLWGMIRNPGQIYQQTQGKASLVLPVSLMLFSTPLSTFLIAISQQGKLAEQIHKKLSKMPNMSQEQIKSIVEIGTSPAAITMAAAMATIAVLITWLFKSGILHLMIIALGGKGTFRQAFVIVGLAWVPVFFHTLGKGVFALATGKVPVIQGNDLASVLISSANLFNIWNIVLLVIGFSIVYGISKKKAAVPILALWLLGVLVDYVAGSLGHS